MRPARNSQKARALKANVASEFGTIHSNHDGARVRSGLGVVRINIGPLPPGGGVIFQ